MNYELILKGFNKIKNLAKSKRIWRFPKKNELVIYDFMSCGKLEEHILRHNNYTVFPAISPIHVPIFLYSLFYIKYGRRAYQIAFLRFVGAKYFLNFHDDSIGVSASAKIAGCKTFMIQNGTRDANCLPKNGGPWKIDFYFVHGEYWKSWVENKINANYKICGSVINNKFPLSKFTKINKVQWISQYTNKGVVPKSRKNMTWEKDVFVTNEFCIKIIKEFCYKYNLKCEVLLRGRGKHTEENEFYDKLGISKAIPINENSSLSQRNYMVKSDDAIVVSVNSTLGYELFGRGFRVGFFSIRSVLLEDSSLRFAWPYKTDDRGPFWCNAMDSQHMHSVLKYLLNVSELEWRQQTNLYSGIMHYDIGNSIIIKTLSDEGVPLSN